MSGGRPFEVNMLASKMVEIGKKKHYDVSDVQNTFRRVSHGLLNDPAIKSSFVQSFNHALSPEQKSVILALARREQPSALPSDLESMKTMGLVAKDIQGQWDVRGELFRDFLLQNSLSIT